MTHWTPAARRGLRCIGFGSAGRPHCRWLPRQLDGIEAAMLLADKSRLDDSVQQAFRTAGVSHLLAVSGLHLALRAAGLWPQMEIL